QSFGEETGRKRTVETVVQSMKSAGNEELVEDYFRMSKLVADEDRPKATAAAAAPESPCDPAAVRAALQGQWKAIRFNAEGQDLPDSAIENLQLTFSNGIYVMNVGQELQTGTFDVSTDSSPMAMTINIGSGKQKGQKRHGAFKLLEEDRLLIVFATNEEDRPTMFVPDKQGNAILAVYEKTK
ncbi:MAG: TIGR03067 domain-containing protein, partial [Planctomycetota bacterium]